MTSSARETYLESQILTATPQKLRLMLIEAAIRYCRQAVLHWQEARHELAFETLLRGRNIVSELLASIDPDATEPARSVRGLYLFVFQHLTEAQMHRDPQRVEQVIDILEEDRQTWQLLCEQMPEAPARPTAIAAENAKEIVARGAAVLDTYTPATCFSWDA